MAVIRTVIRGRRRYRYLVQSYRWEGSLRRKERYLGTSVPANLAPLETELDREIRAETWYALFDKIKLAYGENRRIQPPSVREKETRDFVLEFTYDSNRIEGSTLTLEDTRSLLEKGVLPADKLLSDAQEAQKHARLLARLLAAPEPLDLRHLLGWHRALFGDTKSDLAGRLRDYEVRIRGSRHLPPSALEVRPSLLELLRRVARTSRTVHPVERAADFHFRFEHIHPFGDGNGRVGRLAMNLLLAQEGYPLLNIRYAGRRGYLRALELASRVNDPRPFTRWFFLRYARENRVYLRSRS